MARAKKQLKGGNKDKDQKKRRGRRSDEERAMRMDGDHFKEQEEQRRKEEMLKHAMLERQRAEERLSKINQLKINNQWREILRRTKAETLRKDIEILSQTHEREVDRKDSTIQSLVRNLDESEEQFTMSMRSHIQNVDNLIELHVRRINMLENEFERDLDTLQQEFAQERTLVQSAHVKEKNELSDIMAAMESEFNEAEQEARQDFQSQRDEIKNKNSEEYNVLRITLENQIEELERHFDNAHQNYVTNTEQKTTAFKELTKKDQANSKAIDIGMKRLQKLQDLTSHWKAKMLNNVAECEARNRALKEEKDAITAHYQELKARMNKFRDEQAKRLTELTTNSGECIKKLQTRITKAEKILKLSEMNRKLETEREKVLPFYQSSVTAEEEQEIQRQYDEEKLQADTEERELLVTKPKEESEKAHRMHTYASDDSGQPIQKWKYLDNFYKRYNKALLDKLVLERERAKLADENSQLRTLLKRYLDGISVNDDVMNAQSNPLFIVNNRVPGGAPSGQGIGPRQITVLDGPTIVRTNLLARR